jgi:hypothetical protein
VNCLARIIVRKCGVEEAHRSIAGQQPTDGGLAPRKRFSVSPRKLSWRWVAFGRCIVYAGYAAANACGVSLLAGMHHERPLVAAVPPKVREFN